jgi:hypothetical protein
MYRISEKVRCTHGQDGAVLLDIKQGRIFSLNVVGSRILELLEGGCCESKVVNSISREFEISPEIVENDFREFLTALQSQKLVKEQQADPTA